MDTITIERTKEEREVPFMTKPGEFDDGTRFLRDTRNEVLLSLISPGVILSALIILGTGLMWAFGV